MVLQDAENFNQEYSTVIEMELPPPSYTSIYPKGRVLSFFDKIKQFIYSFFEELKYDGESPEHPIFVYQNYYP